MQRLSRRSPTTSRLSQRFRVSTNRSYRTRNHIYPCILELVPVCSRPSGPHRGSTFSGRLRLRHLNSNAEGVACIKIKARIRLLSCCHVDVVTVGSTPAHLLWLPFLRNSDPFATDPIAGPDASGGGDAFRRNGYPSRPHRPSCRHHEDYTG